MSAEASGHPAESTSVGAPGPGSKPGPETVEGGLRRELGPLDVTFMVMGCIIGAGVFRTPHSVAEALGSAPAVVAVWGVGGVLALLGALVFAELGAMLPRTGGQYVFLREGLGRGLAFFFGWSLLTAITSPALAVILLICLEHAEVFIAGLSPGFEVSDATRRFLGAGTILGLVLLNIRGVRLGTTVHNVAMVAKLVGLLSIVFLALFHAGSAAEAGPTLAEATSTHALTWSAVGLALMPVVFSYGGWQNVSAVATEVRDPARTLPRGILLGTFAVILLYVAINGALLSILGVSGLAASPTPIATAAGRVIPHGETAVALLAVVSTFGICHALMLVTPRIYFAMARDGLFLRSAGSVHPRFGTPWIAILIQGLFACLHLSWGTPEELFQLTTILDWVFFASCGVALFRLRANQPDLVRPYRAWGHPWSSGSFVVLATGVVYFAVTSAGGAALGFALGLSVLGGVVMAWSTRTARG